MSGVVKIENAEIREMVERGEVDGGCEMSELTYGEHLYNYLAGLDYEGLHFEEDEAREWVAEAEALLRVARAAKECRKVILYMERDPHPELKELEDALKEAEKLGIL